MENRKEKSEGKYRIIEVENSYFEQTEYIPQKRDWLGFWRDLSYGKFNIETAEDVIKRDKGEFKIVKYL